MDSLKKLGNYFFTIVVLILVTIIYFKDIKIEKLNRELSKKPTIEYITKVTTETIVQEKLIPVETIKWKPSERDTIYEMIDLTKADSAKIATAYINLYSDFATEKIYDDILKDDSLAFIRIRETVQYNSLFSRQLFYEHRTPIIRITNTEQERTMSVIGGGGGSINGMGVGGGIVTKRNVVYTLNYDPFLKETRGYVYFPIFNFKK